MPEEKKLHEQLLNRSLTDLQAKVEALEKLLKQGLALSRGSPTWDEVWPFVQRVCEFGEPKKARNRKES